MELRSFGRTGVKVSPLVSRRDDVRRVGQPGPRRLDRDHPRGARRRHQLHRHRRRLLGRRVRRDRRQGAQGPPRRRRPRDEGARRDGSATRTRRGNSRRWIVRECEASLQRLQTDYIDLYQIHRPQPDCDIDETLGALTDLVHQGKVRYLGSSTFPPSEIVEAQWVAERRGRERFVCEQPPYSMLVRGIEADVLPTCERYGMAVIPWSPLAGGWLSGKWRLGVERRDEPACDARPGRYDLSLPGEPAQARGGRRARDHRREGGHQSRPHGRRVGDQPSRRSRRAIIGPRTMEQLTTQLGAADVVLDDDDRSTRSTRSSPPGTNFSWADAGYTPPSMSTGQASAVSPAATRARDTPAGGSTADRRSARAGDAA